MPELSAYGANVNAGVNVNDDHGWGNYRWPGGVPVALLGVASYGGLRVTVRRELVELFTLAFQLAERHGYTIYAKRGGEVWGPWSYENRPVGGTSTPSNHSRGKAIDVNAPLNPQSKTFQSDMPVAMVRAWESIGLCWGGRYRPPTKYDAMHFEYGYSPADVAGHVLKARLMMGQSGTKPAPAPTPATLPAGGAVGGLGDWLFRQTPADLDQLIAQHWGID